jgi:hypothetical protein
LSCAGLRLESSVRLTTQASTCSAWAEGAEASFPSAWSSDRAWTKPSALRCPPCLSPQSFALDHASLLPRCTSQEARGQPGAVCTLDQLLQLLGGRPRASLRFWKLVSLGVSLSPQALSPQALSPQASLALSPQVPLLHSRPDPHPAPPPHPPGPGPGLPAFPHPPELDPAAYVPGPGPPDPGPPRSWERARGRRRGRR